MFTSPFFPPINRDVHTPCQRISGSVADLPILSRLLQVASAWLIHADQVDVNIRVVGTLLFFFPQLINEDESRFERKWEKLETQDGEIKF